jgi:hypothetical protein
MTWFAEIHTKNIENLLRLPRSLLVTYVFCKLLFCIGFGFLLSSHLQSLNWELYGWLFILLSFIITTLRVIKLLNPLLPGVCILWRFLLWFGIGSGTLLASYLPGINWKFYGWLLVVLSVIISIPSLHRILKRQVMVGKEIKKDIEFLIKHTLQPKWWKKAKVFLLLASLILIYFIFGIIKAIIWISVILVCATILHFTYRIKTDTYTKSWMDFKVKEIEGKQTYERIGLFYYSLVILIFLTATVVILLL